MEWTLDGSKRYPATTKFETGEQKISHRWRCKTMNKIDSGRLDIKSCKDTAQETKDTAIMDHGSERQIDKIEAKIKMRERRAIKLQMILCTHAAIGKVEGVMVSRIVTELEIVNSSKPGLNNRKRQRQQDTSGDI
jgi:hypothetical protein